MPSPDKQKNLDRAKAWYLANKDRRKEYVENYFSNPDNVKKRKEYRKLSYQCNKHHTLEENRLYQSRPENKVKARELRNKRYAENSSFALSCNLRTRLRRALLDQSASKFTKVADLLGCSIRDFKLYLESKFQEGMSWDNYGEWHIDHIKPCVSFDLTRLEEQVKCFHHTNLQPLWAYDNRSKWRN